MLPTDDCDDCTPAHLQRSLDAFPPSTIAFSLIPFVLTFLVVAAVVLNRLFPILSDRSLLKSHDDGLPFTKSSFRRASYSVQALRDASIKRVAALTFSTSIALSAVLVELILCEISNTLNPAARSLALRATLTTLLVLIIVVTPALEIHSFVSAIFGIASPPGSSTTSTRKPRRRLAPFFEAILLTGWLLCFWYLSHSAIVPATLHSTPIQDERASHSFTEACLERIGIIGISLMAALSGFAA
ncbi:hypothetical protein LTR28_005993, partial [Elasticomyces elasticus]